MKTRGLFQTILFSVIDSTFAWKGLTLSRFRASHHIGASGAAPFGESSSFFLQTENESIFFTGLSNIQPTLEARKKIVILNSMHHSPHDTSFKIRLLEMEVRDFLSSNITVSFYHSENQLSAGSKWLINYV